MSAIHPTSPPPERLPRIAPGNMTEALHNQSVSDATYAHAVEKIG
jgi:hypothetical protein